jgi:hypothetical protein
MGAVVDGVKQRAGLVERMFNGICEVVAYGGVPLKGLFLHRAHRAAADPAAPSEKRSDKHATTAMHVETLLFTDTLIATHLRIRAVGAGADPSHTGGWRRDPRG